MIEREPGPSWERANWPIEVLDELNLGLDPTQATIEKFRQAAADKAAATTADPQAIQRAADKIVALKKAGIEVAPTPADLGSAVQKAIASKKK
jgi:succinyl-CoA synthetase alpha subunit